MYIGELMTESGVIFGTSGARGVAADMSDRVCYAYAGGFLQYLMKGGLLNKGQPVGLAGDHRPSTERIMAACARAVSDLGCRPRNFGRIPTPALASFGIANGMPTMMVTGSHIPDDRNGIKFNLPSGEILKEDEAGIRRQQVVLPSGLFDAEGNLVPGQASCLPAEEPVALDDYVARYLDFFPADCLEGARIGVYEHSSVARACLSTVLGGLGAEVERFGYSDIFIPVDTEAIRPEDVVLARDWGGTGRFDALVSADGDGDRPLVSDEHGEWLRGDVAGVLCARHLGAEGVVTPVSSNTVLEKSGWFGHISRTRIGSPYVIAGMQQLRRQGVGKVVGYEANGGFLTASDLRRGDAVLKALPTRDAVIVAVAVILSAKEQGKPISALVADLPARFTVSDRIKEYPTEISQARISGFICGDASRNKAAVEAVFGQWFGAVADLDTTDGLRITFKNGEIVHLRPSGNAPEMRAYTEADTARRAAEMNAICMELLAGWRT